MMRNILKDADLKYKIFPDIFVDQGKICIEINVYNKSEKIIFNNVKYACYLRSENNILKKQMYQTSNKFFFLLSDVIDDNFIVSCYVIDLDKHCVMNNFKVNKKRLEKKRLFIVGSCVTRDGFNSEVVRKNYDIVGYRARTTLARSNFSGLDFCEDDIFLDSNFIKKVVLNDLNNLLFSELKSTDFDYLIIDFVSDRFGLVHVRDDIYVTNSDDFRKLKIVDNTSTKIDAFSDDFLVLWERGIKKLLDVVSYEKIIINNVFWSKETNLGKEVSNKKRRDECNHLLAKIYNILSKYLPKNQFINYPEGIFFADENHRWGLAPFHYTDEVYDYFIKRVNVIVKQK